jgi:L-alanine-DL-glutamate epimerase-like enolase superfamily enzyme
MLILMLDAIKVGGLPEAQKRAARVSACHKPMSTHSTQPTVSTAAIGPFYAVHPHTYDAQACNIEPMSIRGA